MLQKILNSLLEKRVSSLQWALTFMSVIFLRVFIEQFLASAAPATIYELVIEYLHNFFFFSLAFFLIWIILHFILKISLEKLSGLFLWAQFLILLPPILDMIKTGGSVYWSFYLLGNTRELLTNYFTFFGAMPTGIRYFGTKIVFVLTILVSVGIVYAKTKNIKRSLAGGIGVYSVFFFLGSFPSLFSCFYLSIFEGRNIFAIESFHIAQFFASPLPILGIKYLSLKSAFPYKLNLIYYLLLTGVASWFFFLGSREKFLAVIRNFRYPQVVYHSGLFLAGAGLGYLEFRDSLRFDLFSFVVMAVLLVSIWLAWKASVVVNDIYDLGIDKITNSNRPLPRGIFCEKEYIEFGIICFLLSLLGGLTVGFSFFVLLLVYQILAWFYSAEPFRLKRFLGVATLVSSLASLGVLFMGYILMSSDQTIADLSWRIILLLLIGYTISLPVKDFKDIAGDSKYGVKTLPVIFGEKNGRLILSVNIFIAYMLSVFLLNELGLFFFALIFAVLTYFALNSPRIKPRQIPGAVLVLVGVYGLILVKIVFM